MPKLDEQNCIPFHFESISFYQLRDAQTVALLVNNPGEHFKKRFGNVELVCEKNDPTDPLIVIPDDVLSHLV